MLTTDDARHVLDLYDSGEYAARFTTAHGTTTFLNSTDDRYGFVVTKDAHNGDLTIDELPASVEDMVTRLATKWAQQGVPMVIRRSENNNQ